MPQPRQSKRPNRQQPSGAVVGISELLDGWLQSHHGKTLHWCSGGDALCGCKRSKHGWKAPKATDKCYECEWRLGAVANAIFNLVGDQMLQSRIEPMLKPPDDQAQGRRADEA